MSGKGIIETEITVISSNATVLQRIAALQTPVVEAMMASGKVIIFDRLGSYVNVLVIVPAEGVEMNEVFALLDQEIAKTQTPDLKSVPVRI